METIGSNFLANQDVFRKPGALTPRQSREQSRSSVAASASASSPSAELALHLRDDIVRRCSSAQHRFDGLIWHDKYFSYHQIEECLQALGARFSLSKRKRNLLSRIFSKDHAFCILIFPTSDVCWEPRGCSKAELRAFSAFLLDPQVRTRLNGAQKGWSAQRTSPICHREHRGASVCERQIS